jgi:hypothetical protein
MNNQQGHNCGLQWTVADGLVDQPLLLASFLRKTIARWPRIPPQCEAQCRISAKFEETKEDPRGHSPEHHLIGCITSDVHQICSLGPSTRFCFFHGRSDWSMLQVSSEQVSQLGCPFS